ncbi:MAG: DUF4012 domain-containing protein [Patescibacteria group bacterium]|jgi:hypothetical protein
MFFKKKNKLEQLLQVNPFNKKAKRRWWKFLAPAVLLLIIIAAIIVPLAVNGSYIYLRLVAINNRVEPIMTAATQGDFAVIDAQLTAIRDDLAVVRERTRQLGPILWWPAVAKTARTGDKMMLATGDLLAGYQEMLSVFSDLSLQTQEQRVVFDFSAKESKRQLLASIVKNRNKLEEARNKIVLAKAGLNSVNTDDLTGIFQNKVAAANRLLSEAVEQSEVALPLFKYLPELAGYNQEKNYLILFENNTELRPTGGFIGSYGLVTVKDGDIIAMHTDDIYNLDKWSKDKLQVPAPWPMTAYNAQKYLFLRDANWSPDWPTSARQIEWFWNVERANAGLAPVHLDGIIAITPEFIANFLAVTGPITADGITFTSDNFTYQLEQQVEFAYAARGIDLANRKDIIGDLTKDIIARITKAKAAELFQVWLAMKKNIDEKQVLAYMTDPQLQTYLAQENWSGEMKQGEGDYLYIVDANLAALKTDQVMKRAITYSVTPDVNGDLLAKVEINYQHTGRSVPALITNYRSYTRVYVPEGSWFTKAYFKDSKGTQDLSLDKEVEIKNELGKRYLGVFLTVNQGSDKTLVLEYRLSPEVKQLAQDGLYKLSVQKQPGTPGHKLKIDLKFDQRITAYYSKIMPQRVLGQSLLWDTDLSVDRDFIIKF